MNWTQLDKPLKAESLREIELSLYGKLRAHRISDSFIDRCGEDALQRGIVEYLRVVKEGVSVRNPDAFIVDVAFKRAVDELRREARLQSAVAESAIDDRAEPPDTEEMAIADVLVHELRQAIDALSPEEQQVLSLYFFEQRSAEAGAQLLHLSERSFRRRLKDAIAALSERLGVEIPDPGSGLAIEIGLVAWVSLRGARVAIRQGPLEHLASMVSWLWERLGELVTRTTASGASERAGPLASGPAGKVVGGCAGTLAICALTGVVGPGVGGVDVLGNHNPTSVHHRQPPPKTHSRAPVASKRQAPSSTEPVRRSTITAPPSTAPSNPGASSQNASTNEASSGAQSKPAASGKKSKEKKEREASEVVATQEVTGAVPESPEPEAAAPEESSPGSSSSAAGGSGASGATPDEAASRGLAGGTGL